MTWIAIKAINFYQKYISPYKGFRCAHGVATGEISCSGYGKKVIKRFGLLTGLKLLNRRFYDCSWHARHLNKLKEMSKDKNSKMYRPITGYRSTQGGFVDCDCDCGDCDMPDCDINFCDGLDCIPSDCGKANTAESFKEKRNKKNKNQYGSEEELIGKQNSLLKDNDEGEDSDSD